MNRAEDRNLQEIHWILELDLPALYYPVRSMPGLGADKLIDEAFDRGDFSPLQERRTYRFDAPMYSGSQQLLISKAVRTLAASQKGLRLLETRTGGTPPRLLHRAYAQYAKLVERALLGSKGLAPAGRWSGRDRICPKALNPVCFSSMKSRKEPYPEPGPRLALVPKLHGAPLGSRPQSLAGQGSLAHCLAHAYMADLCQDCLWAGPLDGDKWLAKLLSRG